MWSSSADLCFGNYSVETICFLRDNNNNNECNTCIILYFRWNMAAEHSEKGPSLVTKYDIGLEKLEPKYIQTCSNIKELEKILRILR